MGGGVCGVWLTWVGYYDRCQCRRGRGRLVHILIITAVHILCVTMETCHMTSYKMIYVTCISLC